MAVSRRWSASRRTATWCSWPAPDAWKIKRAVSFPYMDFSTLEKRRVACTREVEVNRRLAPDIYLGCVAVTRAAGRTPRLGRRRRGGRVGGAHAPLRSVGAARATSLRGAGIGPELARAVADTVLESHRGAAPAASADGAAPIGRLATTLSRIAGAPEGVRCNRCASLRARGPVAARPRRRRFSTSARGRGCVRRCHGDLHLGNIVLWDGRPLLFDAIEFDEAIATVDTLYDLAFLLMDLDRHRPAARRQRRPQPLSLARWR